LSRDLGALAALLLAYVVAAYSILPLWWRHHERAAVLRDAPKLTRTAQGIPGDPVNVALVGTREEMSRAFRVAGWYPVDRTTWRSSLHIARAVIAGRAYPEAPVSNLYLWGRAQDLAFQRPVGKSPRQRHHVRFWRAPDGEPDGRSLWLGAATFDRSVGISRRTVQITHHIGADVDAQRDELLRDLQQAGLLADRYMVMGIGPTTKGRNGGGDRYFTDGNLAVGVLGNLPPAVAFK
jgi:hypothetical protein